MKPIKIILVVTAILASSCNKDSGGPDKGGKGRRGGAPAVRVKITESQNLPQTVEVVSFLIGRKQADVYSRVNGKVSYIGPGDGSRVKEGELLFRVDRSEPGESFLATPVTSPISGWVGRWLVTSLGSQVNSQQAVVTVVDDEALRALAPLPTSQWLQVSDTTAVRVKVGEETREAKVIGISRAAEAASSRGTITVEIANSDHKWKAGMVASVFFDLDIKPRLIVPAAALSITDQGAFVYTIEEGKAKRTAVEFQVIDNDTAEITKGLEAGKQIITEGINQVGDGLAVNIVENKPEGKQ